MLTLPRSLAADERLPRLIGATCGVSGALALVGGIGFVVQNDLLELGVLASGVGFLLALVGATVLLRRGPSGEASPVAGLSLQVRINPTRP